MVIPKPHIIRSNRRTVALQILPTGELIVKAPTRASLSFIHTFIEKNREWIEKHLQKARQGTPVLKHEYKHGEIFLYLGEKVMLTIGDYAEIAVSQKQLHFPHGIAFRIQKELKSWYIKQARDLITRQVAFFAEEMDAQYNDVTFSDTRSQWGRCTHDNRLQFSWRLIMAPLLVINYVVIHELVHTKEKNHSAAFWSKVRRYNPSYRQQIKWLKEHGNSLVV
jgi:predicted metal-dependent hydrolase